MKAIILTFMALIVSQAVFADEVHWRCEAKNRRDERFYGESRNPNQPGLAEAKQKAMTNCHEDSKPDERPCRLIDCRAN